MALVRIMKNPVKPFDVLEQVVGDGQTVKSALKELYTTDFKEFSVPTIITLNGQCLMRKQWDTTVLIDGDIMGVVTLPAEPITIFYAVVAVVMLGVSIYTMQMAKKTQNQFDTPAGDPVYSLSGQKNDYRVMEPIEVNYGRSRVWCTYASKPFARYTGNDQWLYQLLCIGQGEYEINDVYIEDTLIDNFTDVSYQIIKPNGKVTLIDTNVETSAEVGNLELFGPNEPDYQVMGPYNIVSAYNRTKKIEVDLELPNGLYLTGKKGLKYRIVEALFEYRSIDDLGNPVGEWQTLFSWTKKMTTVTPQRFTITTNVPWGRYQIRGRRTNNKDTSYKSGNTLKWTAVRAVIPDNSAYGDVTLIAIKAKASNNLNNESASRINVDCTRILQTRSNGAWSKIPTRSICWAFYDVLVSKTYGASLDKTYIDVDELERLDSILMGEGRQFDGTFKNKSTVWETLMAIAKAGRATPTISGTTITMVLDRPKSIPQGVFSVDNIIEGSFEWEISMWDPTESDSIEMTYINPVSFLQESVSCSTEQSDGLNPVKVDLIGCTNRNIAYRDGMYMAMQAKYQREAIRFRTGLEGILPAFGDLISVQYPIPSFGQGSVIVEQYNNLIVVDGGLDWTDNTQHYVMVRGDNGIGYGPYPVSRGSSDDMLVLSNPLPVTLMDGGREPPIVTFGGSTTFSRLCVVTNIDPVGGEEVLIECLNYDPILYSYDESEAPPVNTTDIVPLPSIPIIKSMTVIKIPDILDSIGVSWSPALGATSYVLEQSLDGEQWQTVTTTPMTSWQMQVFKGMLYLRVAGIGAGRGPYVQWSGEVGDVIDAPEDVGVIRTLQEFIGTSFSIEWDSVLTADKYRVLIYSGGVLARSIETTVPNFTYTLEMAKIDGLLSRQYNVVVFAVNAFGDSDPATITMNNALPASPTSLAYSVQSTTATYRSYKVTWAHPSPPPDLGGYKVYMSETSGFTPTDASLIFDGVSLGASAVVQLASSEHTARYIKVGAYDVWGNQVAVSSQITIPAYSGT